MGQAAAGTSADMLGTDQTGAYSSGYGNAIYAMQCPEGIDQDIALLATAAALAVGIYVVYRQITLQTMGRKKRSILKSNGSLDKTNGESESLVDNIADIVYMGLEE